MTARVLSWWAWLKHLFVRRAPSPTTIDAPIDGALALTPDPEPAIPEPAIPESPPEPEPRKTRWDASYLRTDVERDEALWHFRGTILDRLDEYFACIRRLKTHDADGYKLFARLGFAVPSGFVYKPELMPVADAERPSVGGILFGGLRDHLSAAEAKRGDHPTFAYFQKMHIPSRVQLIAGDIYRFVLIFDDRDRSAQYRALFSYPVECHINVARDGTVTLLKELVQTKRHIVTNTKAKHPKGRRRRETITVTGTQWDYPKWTKGQPNEAFKEGAPFVEYLFRTTFLTQASCTKRILIRARNIDHLVATFGIDLARAKVFFRDRDELLAADGKRKRIFHAVTEHTRHLHTRHKTETTVRFHYRGLRDFVWNTYRIHIVLPNLTDLVKFPFPSFYKEDQPEGARMITSTVLGKRIGAELEK